MYNIFSQFLTVNTLSGYKGCNDFPRACTCLIIQKKIDSGTMAWNTKICKRSKLWEKATKEKKRDHGERNIWGQILIILLFLSFSIYVCIRRKACEVTEKLLFTHFSTLTRVLKQSNHAWNFLRECYFHLYTWSNFRKRNVYTFLDNQILLLGKHLFRHRLYITEERCRIWSMSKSHLF